MGDFIRLGEFSHSRLNEQTQYSSRFIDGRHGTPNLGQGLRFRGDPREYHEVEIHKDDVDTFVDRILTYWREHESWRGILNGKGY